MKNSVSSRKKSARKSAEKTLQYRAQQWLEKSGTTKRLLIFHVANERKSSIGAALHFKRMGVMPGVADYLAFPHGRAVAVELKDDKGKQSKEQQLFQKRWEAAGHSYFIVRTLEEFQGTVEALLLFN